MDRNINVRFFSVECKEGDSLKFSDCLNAISKMTLPKREKEVEPEIVMRLERLDSVDGHFLAGQLVRLQTENLPPKALRGKPIEKLGIDGIGHTAAFRYDLKKSILAMQVPRNGVNPYRMDLYNQCVLGIVGHNILPIISNDAWIKLSENRIRKLMFRVARPEKLSAQTSEQNGVRNSLVAMKEISECNYVEMSLGMGRAPEDFNISNVRRLFGWLYKERENNNGGIRKISAEIINLETEEHEILSLTHAHMGERQKLDLPSDSPNKAYEKVDGFIRHLFKQFAEELNSQYSN